MGGGLTAAYARAPKTCQNDSGGGRTDRVRKPTTRWLQVVRTHGRVYRPAAWVTVKKKKKNPNETRHVLTAYTSPPWRAFRVHRLVFKRVRPPGDIRADDCRREQIFCFERARCMQIRARNGFWKRFVFGRFVHRRTSNTTARSVRRRSNVKTVYETRRSYRLITILYVLLLLFTKNHDFIKLTIPSGKDLCRFPEKIKTSVFTTVLVRAGQVVWTQ